MSEQIMVHGIEVKPGQVWEYEPNKNLPSRVVKVRDGFICCEDDDDIGGWQPHHFALCHKRLASDAVVMAPAPEPASKEPERWTDARYAEEQVAMARRQAEVARTEARELRAELDAVATGLDEQTAASGSHMRLAHERAEAAEAERDKLRADLDAVRAALEAARAAVHTPSPGVDDRRRSHPARDEGPDQRLVDGVVDAASAARRGAPRVVAEGRDPATRTRAETPPYDPGNCESCRNPIEGDYYRNREPGDIGGENYHRDCWAWVRSCGKGPRPRRYREEHKPSPCIALSAEQVHEALGWNVPAPTRALPVVPETCGECRYISGDPWTCGHPGDAIKRIP